MAWGNKQERERLIAEHAAENVAMKREIDLLREIIVDLKCDKVDLSTRLQNTQEALIAKESPEAYRDQKYAEEQARFAEDDDMNDARREAARVQGIRAETTFQHLQNLEGDLFHDADDMITLLTPAAGVPMGECHSLHGNSES